MRKLWQKEGPHLEFFNVGMWESISKHIMLLSNSLILLTSSPHRTFTCGLRGRCADWKVTGPPTLITRKQEPDFQCGKRESPWVILGLSSHLTLQFRNIAHFMVFSYLSCHITLIILFTVVDYEATWLRLHSFFLFQSQFKWCHWYEHNSPAIVISILEITKFT